MVFCTGTAGFITKSACRGWTESTCTANVSEAEPAGPVAVALTLFGPGMAKACVTSAPDALAPSPKSQVMLFTSPVMLAWKAPGWFTDKEADPVIHTLIGNPSEGPTCKFAFISWGGPKRPTFSVTS